MRTDNAWLAQVAEDIVDPDQEIVDPHHHLWKRQDGDYELSELWADTSSGHNVVQTVFIQCGAYYDMDAPRHMRPLGETRRVAEIAEASRADPTKATIAGIVGYVNLTHDGAEEMMALHEEAGRGLLKGIRHGGARDPHPEALSIAGTAAEGQYADPLFRANVARLGERGLTFDTWHYHHQNRDFLALARAVPGTTMILDHFGTPLGVGPYAGKRDEIFAAWKDDIAAIAECPNVVAKLGGMAMPDNGYGWHTRAKPPTSDEFVEAQGDWYQHTIDCFGPDRCMFESNFPVDRQSISYPVLWNAFKKIAAGFSKADRDRMFFGTARRVYRL